MCANVHQPDASKLNATVTLDSEVVEVTPAAGADLAREHYYDRNPSVVIYEYHISNITNHSFTVRWTYTVPANRKALHGIWFAESYRTVVAAAASINSSIECSNDAGSTYYKIAKCLHFNGSVPAFETNITLTASFTLVESDILRGFTSHNDTGVVHGHTTTSILTEYDE